MSTVGTKRAYEIIDGTFKASLNPLSVLNEGFIPLFYEQSLQSTAGIG